jgi:subtilisin-like proprotein convertase family protein
VWAFAVNWTTPANSTFTKVADIQTAEFDSTLCGLTSFYCMGMPGVTQGATNSLDPLREVIMNRLAYRKFSGHETLVGNFVTDIGSNIGGVRWFELRKVGAGSWTLYQEGTYAPTTSDNRWMGGIAMDGSGNIALGYNVSSQTIYPSLRYAGRLATDPLGTLPQGEYTIVNGTAVNGSNRYGDYAAMGIDPIDDCTFWFTGQWNAASQWSTRIAAFKFDACGTADFTLAAAPEAQDVCVATNAVYDVTVGQVQSYTDDVTLSASGNPAGTTTNFSANPVTPPGSSQLTIGNTAAAATGSYMIDIVGVALTSTHTTTVQLNLYDALTAVPTLLTPANGASDVALQPTFTWDAVDGSASYFIEIATDSAFTNVVDSATVSGTSHTPAVSLDDSTLYYWRVKASNICGDSAFSAVSIFVTVASNLECNVTPISIPDSGSGTPYPSGIAVSGYGASLLDVNVHLLGLAHTYPDDLDLLLVGPQGQNLIIMSDVGGGDNVTAVDLILDDAAAGQIPDAGPLVSGTFKPTNIGTGDTFPAPAPAPSTATTLATFNGTNPNGTWNLFVYDDAGGDLGSLAGGWCLDLGVAGGGTASLALTKTVGTDPLVYPTTDAITVTSGVTVTYFYVVENTGTITMPLHTLEDTQLGTILGPDYAYDLAPGEILTITASALVTETVTNTAIWLATDGGATTAVAADSATVTVTGPTFYYLYLPVIMKP